MKNLVSRNPVLRFKLGRKINKFENPSLPIYLMDNDRNRYKIGSDGKYYELSDSGKYYKARPGKTFEEINNTKKEQLTSLSKIKNTIPLGLVSSYKNMIKNRKPTSLNRIKNNEVNYNSMMLAKLGGWNKNIGLGNINDSVSQNYLKELGWEGKTAEQVQNLLNENNPGGYLVNVDNKWGNLSRSALEAYYNRWKEQKANNLVSNITPITQPIFPEFKPLDAITPEVKEKIAMDGYTPNVVEQKVMSAPVTYNKSMTRDWLRNNIGTAYGVSGLTRRATKNALNRLLGDGDLELIALNPKLYKALQALGLFKKGGNILPSRNIVTRFKLRNFRLVAQ